MNHHNPGVYRAESWFMSALLRLMQTRMDAEIVVFSQSRVGSQVIRNTKYKTSGKRVVKQSGIKTKIRIAGYQTRTRQNQNQKTKGCHVQFLDKLAYTKSAQNKDQCSDGLTDGQTGVYNGSNNYLIPCWFCRFAHLQRMELCIILIIGTF